MRFIASDSGLTSGQKKADESIPVVIASDQPTFPVITGVSDEAQYSHAKIDISSSGDNTIIAAVAGQTIRIHRLVLVAKNAVDAVMKSGSTELVPEIPLGALVWDLSTEPWLVTAAGEAFVINLSGAYQVSGIVQYRQS